jgi:hypothetical protein
MADLESLTDALAERLGMANSLRIASFAEWSE